MKICYGNHSNHCTVIGQQKPNMFGNKCNQLTNKSLSTTIMVMELKANKILVQQAQFKKRATRSPQPSPSGVTTIMFMIILLAYFWCSSCYATSSSSSTLYPSSAKQQKEQVSSSMTTLPSTVKLINRISKGDKERLLHTDQQQKIGASSPEQGQGQGRRTLSQFQKRQSPAEDMISEYQTSDIDYNNNRDLSLITDNSDEVNNDRIWNWPEIASEKRFLLNKYMQNISSNNLSLSSPGWYGYFNQDNVANMEDDGGNRFGGHSDVINNNINNNHKPFPATITGSTESMLQPDGFNTINHMNKLLLSTLKASPKAASIAEVAANQQSNPLGALWPESLEKLAKTNAKQAEMVMKMMMMTLAEAKNRKYVQELPDNNGKHNKNIEKQYLKQLLYKNHLNWNPFWLWVIQQQQQKQPESGIFDYYHQQQYQNERKYPDLFDPNEINERYYHENHNQPEQKQLQQQEQTSASPEMMRMMMMKRFRTENARFNDRNDVMNDVGHGTTTATKMLQKNRANQNKSYQPNGNVTIASNNYEINQNQNFSQRQKSKSKNRYYRQRVNQSNAVNNNNNNKNNKNLARDHYYENGKNSGDFQRHQYYQNQNNRKQKPGKQAKQIKPNSRVNYITNNNKNYHYRPVDDVYAEEMAIISAANDFEKQKNRTKINASNDKSDQEYKTSNTISNYGENNNSGKNHLYRNNQSKVEWNNNGKNNINRNRYRPPKPTKSPSTITTTTTTTIRMESSIFQKSLEQKPEPKQQLFYHSRKNPLDSGNRSPPVYGIAKSRSQRHLGEYDQSPQPSQSSSSSSSSAAVSSKLYDVPQIECPSSENGMDRFACPTRDDYGRYLCIDDQHICDGYYDCPRGEDEDRRNCMFYKSTKAHLDLLADYLLQWARGQQNM